jgi:hypothetical protein
MDKSLSWDQRKYWLGPNYKRGCKEKLAPYHHLIVSVQYFILYDSLPAIPNVGGRILGVLHPLKYLMTTFVLNYRYLS